MSRAVGIRVGSAHAPMKQSFLVLFFKKELLFEKKKQKHL
jgi:hypothetical protein